MTTGLTQVTSPKIVCQRAEVGVVLVHGIGNQNEAQTRDEYGGAIARMWANFAGSGQGYRHYTCTKDHIHLVRPDGSHAAVMDEAHWQPVADHAPHRGKLFLWLLTVVPWLLIHWALRPLKTRPGQSPVQVVWLLFLWLARWVYTFMLLAPAIIAMGFVMLVLSAAAAVGLRWADGLLAIIGDTYRYTRAGRAATGYADIVAETAGKLHVSDRLLVVAHSQGGAVTYDAIKGGPAPIHRAQRRHGWPTHVRTQVITLGSGHKRLSMLRMMIAPPQRLVGTVVGAAILTASSALALAIPTEAMSVVPSVSLYGVSALAGLALWRISLANGRQIGSTVRDANLNWCDIWASLDPVPDGPLPHSGIAAIEVHNSHSLVADHTSYQHNPAQVVSRLVDAIDYRRLSNHQVTVEAMRSRRERRYRSWTPQRFLLATVSVGLVAVYRPVCKRRTAAEFAGDIDAAGRRPRTRRVPKAVRPARAPVFTF